MDKAPTVNRGNLIRMSPQVETVGILGLNPVTVDSYAVVAENGERGAEKGNHREH